jgi:A/G-specific adenine glycosylase
MDQERFKTTIWDYYKKSGRHSLPWRHTKKPYEILVSEVMLQQTQVSRALIKYPDFLKAFPTVQTLATAKTADVLKVWQGLGYNRRALFLKKAAEVIVKDFSGIFPQTAEELESLPGIGQSTRGAIMAFAFGIPTIFIETNIRAVFLHFFFRKSSSIHDRNVLALIKQTLDQKNPRDWYYALMDYGLHLKQTVPNPSRKSAHHAKQSPFKGSQREIRSRILKFVLSTGTKGATPAEISKHISVTKYDVSTIIKKLTTEGFIKKTPSEGRLRA